ncbi:MAG: CFI-box-CTERM domain-containing protein [Deltaproteobacteria bacterium]|nr:CFI-box-CTERM domain-containing protein [Deltaproteobacteria bacterium]
MVLLMLRSFLVCITFLAVSHPCSLYASTCTPTVSSGGSIQTAIDAANSGDTVCIGAGTYYEQLTLKDGITLKGEELGRTIIDGSGSGTVILGAYSTNISNLTIKNGTYGIYASKISKLDVNNTVIVGNGYGFYSYSSELRASNSVLDLNTTSAIYFYGSKLSQITLLNTILSNNNYDISSDDLTELWYSLGNNLTYNNANKTFGNYSSDSTVSDQDPLFVDTASNDYHLKSSSPAQNAGYGTDPDSSTADIGAYGGSGMDNTPFTVSGLSTSETADNTLTLSWSANSAYNIAGYKVYFDSDASGAPYDGSSTEGTSPIDAGNVTSFTLSGLTATATAPEPPTGLIAAPGNKAISVSWNAVDGATGYIVYWGTSPGNYAQNTDVGNTTSYTIQGLTNGTVYYISVSAYSAPTYYVAVTAYDSLNNESVLISETSAPLSNVAEGLKSGETSEYPEESVPFPNLKDEGLCFIATAIYGSNMEPDVAILRKFRNHYLLTNPIGRGLTAVYYSVSPPMADFIRDHELLKSIARIALLPFILVAKLALLTSFNMKLILSVFLALLAANLVVARKRILS